MKKGPGADAGPNEVGDGGVSSMKTLVTSGDVVKPRLNSTAKLQPFLKRKAENAQRA
jgi:hypothetical protein